MSSASSAPRWAVLNQSHSPAFQRLLERLSGEFGPCLLLSGSQFPSPEGSRLTIRQGPRYDRTSKVTRALSWARYSAWAALELVRTKGRPPILVVTNPPTLPLLAWLFDSLRGRRFAILVWDIYPDHVVRMGWIREQGVVHRAWAAATARALRAASAVITIGDAMADTLAAYSGTREAITVIPNWADLDQFRPIPRNENQFVRQHALEASFVVLYSGNIGASHGLSVIVEAARLSRNHPRLKYVVVGDGLGRPGIEAGVREHGLDNVLLLPEQPWELVPEVLASADVALVAQASGVGALSVPSKTYALLASSVPVIALCDAGSDLAGLVETHGAGVRVAPEDPAALHAAVVELMTNPARVDGMRKAARRAAAEHFSEDVVLPQFASVLRRLFAG